MTGNQFGDRLAALLEDRGRTAVEVVERHVVSVDAKDDLLLLRPFAGTLKTLDLQRTEITDAGLQTIAELTSLESLNLAGTAIRGSGLVHLSTLNKLQHLDLRETKVGPEHLQALGALTSLRTIQVPKAAITDEVLSALGRLPHRLSREKQRFQERISLPVVALEFTSRCGLRLGATIRGGGAWGQGGQRGTGCGQLGRDQVNNAPAQQ